MMQRRKSRSLVLIRHAMPKIDTANPPGEWELSDTGRASCLTLANRLRQFTFREIISSTEPKAAGTAQALADILNIDYHVISDLHEHERNVMRWYGDEEYQLLFREFFQRPDELIFGRETASQALTRFQIAVEDVVRRSRANDIVIVSHGTVMSLYIAACTGADPYEIWRNLELPDMIVLPTSRENRGLS